MNSQNTHTDSTASIVLYGAIQFANIDYTGVVDYAVKALIGGMIWLGFKLTADYINHKRQKGK